MKYTVILIFLIFPLLIKAQEKHAIVHGIVKDSGTNKPLAGATVRLNNSPSIQKTDAQGRFSIFIPQDARANSIIEASYIGYKRMGLTPDKLKDTLVFALQANSFALTEVSVSTGYQKIAIEKVTGSFSVVDQDLLNRKVSTGILNRIEDAVPGLVFNRNNSSNPMSIRGKATIYGDANPLIVLDNFPYEGDVNSLNPNDVESITVLKDAAAASIWGARAGNGVIVITTKKGSPTSKPKVSYHSNLTLSARPDLFYKPIMSCADFIAMEKELFAKGYYQSAEKSASHAALTPVVELLIAKRDNPALADQVNTLIDAFGKQDVRNDFRKYLYRNSINQQHALNLSGGTAQQRYYLSAGYDKNLESLVENGYSRVTLNATNSYSLLNNKLEINAGIWLAQSRNRRNNGGPSAIGINSSFLFPYAQLADNNGNPLVVTRDYRPSFIAASEQKGLLNWEYNPLDEIIQTDNETVLSEYRINGSVDYKLLQALKISLSGLYSQSQNNYRNMRSSESYFALNLVNTFSKIAADGSILRPLPAGGIVDMLFTGVKNYDVRAQLSYDKGWQNEKHQVSAIAGYEIREIHSLTDGSRMYGYDQEHATSKPVDLARSDLPIYYSPGITRQIPDFGSETDLTDRYISWYTNVAYIYNQKYIFSTSARLDRSNLFGVAANQKGVPLWSAGVAWNISKEDFYHSSRMPYLKLRASYGHTGNVDKSLSAYTTASYFSNAPGTLLPYATIINPPNPELRWERVKIINFGMDFKGFNNRIFGSLDYYKKKGVDLIGDIPYAPQTGVATFRSNAATTSGRGLELDLNSLNMKRKLEWQTNLTFSYNADKVTDYQIPADAASLIAFQSGPLPGKPYNALYSYAWAGLDPNTGDPMGYLEGVPSKEYTKIFLAATAENIIYKGSTRPVIFGALRNTFTFGNLSFSASMSYRIGYWFRRTSINYTQVLSGQGGHGDYSLRWQSPGDEKTTQVPSKPLTSSASRDSFYQYSAILTERADHIRFQDINIAYQLDKSKITKLPVRAIRLYAYLNNIGLLWTANTKHTDPDYQSAPPPRSFAVGVKIDL
jgi:TonB-linked SusC/RagA family outer membrane protein